jgi:hypothetical protein
MSDPVKPSIGSLAIDCSSLGFLVDLPIGGQLGFLTEQPGFPDAVDEIVSNQAIFGAQAGVTQADVDAITTANSQIDQIDAILPAARKIVEMLEETRAKLDDERQRRVFSLAAMIEGRAKVVEDRVLLAKYEKTRAYRSASGVKAAKTRKKNKAANTVTES